MKNLFFIILISIISHSGFARENGEIADFVAPLIQPLVNGPGDIWENSGNGGYLLKFEYDLDLDGTSEVFISSTLYQNDWRIISKSEGKLIGSASDAIRFPISEFTVRKVGTRNEIIRLENYSATGAELHTYSLQSGSLKYNKQTVTREQADTVLAGTEGYVTVKPEIEGIALEDFIQNSETSWEPLNLEEGSLYLDTSGYYRLRGDQERVDANSFTPAQAISLLQAKFGKDAGSQNQKIEEKNTLPSTQSDFSNKPSTVQETTGTGHQESVSFPWFWVGLAVISVGVLLFLVIRQKDA